MNVRPILALIVSFCIFISVVAQTNPAADKDDSRSNYNQPGPGRCCSHQRR